ncbi:DUF4247 domain-containing protein [Streptomyces sp. Amel2xC10]|uniref:DUF4247 domain-containing protein n=1 Tax=Streptomyces sp. Amel2xC10 TaxID=1305826 RepID=UPI000A0837F2|nr:DUF4247 domain-containing protein [Streptomyces sp. Amel2xC10]SMF50275.1 protein of unknown function [Streptomyces sp. Amel2xC10]
MNGSRLTRAAVTAVLAAVLLTACSSDGGDGVPRGWIGDTYRAQGVGWLDPDSNPIVVADAIHGHRRALDRASGDSMEFLRYGDDLVTVSPSGAGSRIEIEDYRSGYRRHSQYLYNWPGPDSDSFRGGGPGEGK